MIYHTYTGHNVVFSVSRHMTLYFQSTMKVDKKLTSSEEDRQDAVAAVGNDTERYTGIINSRKCQSYVGVVSLFIGRLQ